MISMLIYSCKHEEIEILENISKDIVAYSSDERLSIIKGTKMTDISLNEIENIDIAFVDITIDFGLELAKQLRKQFENVEIIIISDQTISPIKYLTPNIRAISLLLKPLNEDLVHKELIELYDVIKINLNHEEDFFVFEYDKEQRKIPYSKILFFEAKDKKVYICLEKKEYGFYATLDTLEKKLPTCFKRCHRGFIVNTIYIRKVKYAQGNIILRNDVEIPISRSYKNVIKEIIQNAN